MRKFELRLARCDRCSMIFATPVPKGFLDGSFYDQTGSRFYLSGEKLSGDYSPVRYQREISLLRKFCRRGRVLDVGCSTGGFLHFLNRSFPGDYQAHGIDVASDAAAFAERMGLTVIRSNFLELFGPRFDAITFWAVLEHAAEPGRLLEAAARLLEPEGCCLVLVPNIESLATRLLGRRYRYILPQHINYFSRSTLLRLARSRGFQVAYCSTTHFNPLVILQDFRRPSTFVPDAERAELLGRTNALKSSKLLTPARWIYTAIERALGGLGLADNLAAVLRPSSR